MLFEGLEEGDFAADHGPRLGLLDETVAEIGAEGQGIISEEGGEIELRF